MHVFTLCYAGRDQIWPPLWSSNRLICLELRASITYSCTVNVDMEYMLHCNGDPPHLCCFRDMVSASPTEPCRHIQSHMHKSRIISYGRLRGMHVSCVSKPLAVVLPQDVAHVGLRFCV